MNYSRSNVIASSPIRGEVIMLIQYFLLIISIPYLLVVMRFFSKDYQLCCEICHPVHTRYFDFPYTFDYGQSR